MKILANDGIDAAGKNALQELGYTVLTDKVSQEELASFIVKENVIGLLVRSATTARKELIDTCAGTLRFIGRGGVGIDNIDKDYAESKGIRVFNTPGASSQSVAELVMSLMFASARFTYQSGANMSSRGNTEFDKLKKDFSKGIELRGKTLGIIGFGKIGRSLASYALGCGMNVLAFDVYTPESSEVEVTVGTQTVRIHVPMEAMETVLQKSDFVSLHVPKQKDGSAVIGEAQLAMMKKGAVIINSSRGGVVHEDALIASLNSGHLRMAALDVFEKEPTPRQDLLAHPLVISTPHIGASTLEAQERIGLEIAARVKEIMSEVQA